MPTKTGYIMSPDVVLEEYKKGNQVVVVLSAMGKQTDVLMYGK